MKYLDNYQLIQDILAGDKNSIAKFHKIYIKIIEKQIKDVTYKANILMRPQERNNLADEMISWLIYGLSLSGHSSQSNKFLALYDGESCSLKTYVIQKVRGEIHNVLRLNKLRTNKTISLEEDQGEQFEIPKLFNNPQELEKRIKSKYNFLSDEEVKDIALFSLDYTYEEIGEILNIENKSLSYRRVTAYRIITKAIKKIKGVEGIL